MKHIFYFIAILFILYEIYWLTNTKRAVDDLRKRKRVLKENKDVDWSDMSDSVQSVYIRAFMAYILFIWLFVGLLTFNWFAFLLFLLWSFLFITPINKFLTEDTGGEYPLLWLNSLVGLCLGVWVILNSYHFKIDLWELITSSFGW